MKFLNILKEDRLTCEAKIANAKKIFKMFSKGSFKNQDDLSGKPDIWEYEYQADKQSRPQMMCVGNANKIEITLVINYNKPLPFVVKLNGEELNTENHLDSTKESLLSRLRQELNNKLKHFGIVIHISSVKY